MENQYYVYFLTDKNDKLIYVGKSINIYSRIKSHINNKTWGEEISIVQFRIYPNEATMTFFEKYYIYKLKPRYNITDNTSDSLNANVFDDSRKEIHEVHDFIKKNKSKNNTVKRKIEYNTQSSNFSKQGEKYLENREIIKSDLIDLFKYKYDLDKTAFFNNGRYHVFTVNDTVESNNKMANTAVYNLQCILLKKQVITFGEPIFLKLNCITKNGIRYINVISGKGKTITSVTLNEKEGFILQKNKLLIEY